MVKRIAIRFLLFFVFFVFIVVANLVIFNILASDVTEGVPIQGRDPDQMALLVIDIQEGTTGSTSTMEEYISQSESLIGQVNRLVKEGMEKDWTIIWVRSEVANPLINLINNSLARGSSGAELDGRLGSLAGQVVVKRRNDPFNKTSLDSILEENGIGKLVFAGLDAEHCVLSAIQAAANRGYGLTVYKETVIAREVELLDKIFGIYKEMGVELLSME
jgi:nicotinamidase-related amidase